MLFYKKDLIIDYTDNEQIKLLIPYVMIECAKQIYGYNSEALNISISAMWNLVTQSKKQLAKRERNNIVTLFEKYFNDGDTYTYEANIEIDGFKENKNCKNYIIVDMKDIVTTQNLEPVYMETGAFFIFRKEVFTKLHQRIGVNPYMCEISQIEAVDIDTYEDFKFAEAVAHFLNK